MAYKLSQKAQAEIIEIYRHGLETHGETQADLYHDGLAAVFDLLAHTPELAREREELTPSVRIHPHGAHLIIYRVEDNRDVLIISIRHAGEDWQDEG